jgi:hypothetical protein
LALKRDTDTDTANSGITLVTEINFIYN